MTTRLLVILILVLIVISFAVYKLQETFIVENKCEFIPWGPSKRACMDRCRNDRKLWGGNACSKAVCYNLCETCTEVDKCGWLSRRELLKDPNANAVRTVDTPLVIRGIEADRGCIIQWFHKDGVDSYMLKYYMSSRPTEGVKIFSINEFNVNLNIKSIGNLENDVEYSFVIVPIKDNTRLPMSNILRLVPNPKLNIHG
jgi:hypothetical protein